MKNLLYIEDNPGDREIASEDFKNAGISITCVENIENGLTALACMQYDLVVCDMLMPGDDGLSFANQYSALDFNIPFALTSGISALKGFEDYKGFKNYLGFILKPITPEKMHRIMRAK